MEDEARDDSEDVEIFEIRHLRFELDDQPESKRAPQLDPHPWPFGPALVCCRDNIKIEFSGMNGESQFLLKSEASDAGREENRPTRADHPWTWLWAPAGTNEDSSTDQKIKAEMEESWPPQEAPLKTEAPEDHQWTHGPTAASRQQDMAVMGKAPPTLAAAIMDDKWQLQETPPITENVLGLKKDLIDIMMEFNLDFSRTVQCVFFNSGEVGSTRHFLRTGRRPDGCPIWEPKDDADLKRKNPKVRARLVRKYGQENLARRATFLRG